MSELPVDYFVGQVPWDGTTLGPSWQEQMCCFTCDECGALNVFRIRAANHLAKNSLTVYCVLGHPQPRLLREVTYEMYVTHITLRP